MSIVHLFSGSLHTSGNMAFTASSFTFDPPLTDPGIFLGSGILSSSFSQSIAQRVSATEVGAPAVTTSLVGNNLTVRVGQYSGTVELPISGNVTTSIDWDQLANIPDGLLSGSVQIAAEISGANSESFAGRLTVLETSPFVSGAAQLATEISGASTALSTSLADRIGTYLTTTKSATAGDDIVLDSDLGRMYGDPTPWAYANTIPVNIVSESIVPGGTAILRTTTPNGLTFNVDNGLIIEVGDLNMFHPSDVNQYEFYAITAGANPTISVKLLGAEDSANSVVQRYAGEISGAFGTVSGALAGRLTTLEGKSLVSGAAQLATEISGAFTQISGALSESIATLNSKTLLSGSAQIASNISGAFADSVNTLIGSDLTIQGNLDAIDSAVIRPLSTSYYAISASIYGGTSNIPTESILNFATAVSAAASDFNFGSSEGSQSTAWTNVTSKPPGLLSSSAQIASEISGAVSINIGDYASEISGAFGADSSSIESRLTTLSTDKADKTAISGAFTAPSTSLASRVTIVETNKADKTAVSGAFTIVSGGFSTRITSNETNIAANSILAAKTEFTETAFRVVNNSDPSKKVRFELSAISSGQTRQIIMPDADVDLGNLGSGGSGVATASEVYFQQASASVFSSSNVHDILVEINERTIVSASFPAIPYNQLSGAFSMSALEVYDAYVTESQILSDIGSALFPEPNYSGAVPNFKAGRMAVTGGNAYWGLTYDTASQTGTVLRTPLFETFDALQIETDTITKLGTEGYWNTTNAYRGPAITASDLVVGEQYYDVEEENLWYECVTGSTNYWVRRGNRVPDVISYKLTPYGEDGSASVTTPKDVDVFEKPFYVIDTWLYASTAPVGNSASADIRDDGTSIYSGSGAQSLVRIAASSKSGSQAVTAHLIDSGSEVSVYLLNTGSSTPGQNYKISLVGFWKY